MAHRFIGKAQRGVHPAIAVAHQSVIERSALDQTSRQQLLHLLLEPERARRSDLLHKRLGREFQAEQLAADGRLGNSIAAANLRRSLGRAVTKLWPCCKVMGADNAEATGRGPSVFKPTSAIASTQG